jgi:hypothetical protein
VFRCRACQVRYHVLLVVLQFSLTSFPSFPFQIETLLKMESHEETIHKMVEKNRIDAAKKEMKKKAKQVFCHRTPLVVLCALHAPIHPLQYPMALHCSALPRPVLYLLSLHSYYCCMGPISPNPLPFRTTAA